MNKKKIRLIIICILGAPFIFSAIRTVSTVIKTRAKQAPAAVPKKITVSKVSFEKRLARIEAKTEQIGWARNPFVRGRVSGPAGVVSLNLSGIIWDEQNPSAIIGNTVVMEGDAIGKYKVIKINRASVILSSEEGKKILNIWEEE